MTANIVLILVFDSGARTIRTGFFQSGFAVFWSPCGRRQRMRGPKGPRGSELMGLQAFPVKEGRRLRGRQARGLDSAQQDGRDEA
jgi:hypothetical protein